MTLTGTDVSSYQGETPDYTGNDFVISKATEGTYYLNPYHASQVAAARAQGKLVGHYHFLTDQTPELQAQFFWNNCSWLPGEQLAVDVESPFADTPGAVESTRRFVIELMRLSGFPCEVYADASHVNTLDFTPVAALGSGLWGAAYNGTGFGPTGAFPFVAIWQNADTNPSSHGDSDVFYGDAAAWHKYGTPDGAQPATPIAQIPVPAPLPANVYVVQNGDTYSGIAESHGLGLSELETANPGQNYDLIHPGDHITIPDHVTPIPTPAPVLPPNRCIVEAGDTLSGIAAQFGVSLDTILANNPGITNPDLIFPGQVINL